MSKSRVIRDVCLGILGVVALSFGATTLFDFENVAVGELPAGWKVELMNATTPFAKFACVVDATVPGAQAGNHVMKITEYASGGAYANCTICWTDAVSFQDGTIEAYVMATGGAANENYVGLAWRIKDKNNYYAARFSPSEGMGSFKIVNGTRTSIGSNSGTKTYVANTWYKFKVVQAGNTFTIFVDNTEVRTATNSDITGAGGVGLFMRSNTTKAEWDNLSITTAGSAVRPSSMTAVQGGIGLGKTTVKSTINLQGRSMPVLLENGSGNKASAVYYGIAQNSNRAIPVLNIKK
jgi:hypothetical protein